MANQLFNALGINSLPAPFSNMQNMMNQFEQFRKGFGNANPKEIVMNMVNSGRLSQDQLNRAQQAANQFQQFLSKNNK